MHAVLDYPTSGQAIDRQRFNVRGWVWLGEHQPAIAAVGAWSGDSLLGQGTMLNSRPDVTAALALPADALTGFDFFADAPAELVDDRVAISLRVRFHDGARSGSFCPRDLAVRPARTRETLPPARPPAARPPASASEALPPDHLQIRQVAGVWGPLFFSEGRVIFDQLAEAFRAAGRPLGQAAAVLDFGCGCGRVLRSFRDVPHAGEVWGSDLDAEAIEWNRAHLGDIAQFHANAALPPTEFRTGQFEAIYAVSVFTHLPEELQFAWLTELRRILRPGGVLVASLHGAHYWQNAAPDVRAEVESRGFAYRTGNRTDGLPDFYMVAFHAAS